MLFSNGAIAIQCRCYSVWCKDSQQRKNVDLTIPYVTYNCFPQQESVQTNRSARGKVVGGLFDKCPGIFPSIPLLLMLVMLSYRDYFPITLLFLILCSIWMHKNVRCFFWTEQKGRWGWESRQYVDMMYEPGGTEMKPMLLLLFTKSKSSESQLLLPGIVQPFSSIHFFLKCCLT